MHLRKRHIREQLGIYSFAIVASFAALAAAIWWIEPAPPSTIRLAAGAPGGAYMSWAEEYKRLLGMQGIKVEIQPTAGALENLDRLAGDEADIGFIQAGLTLPPGQERVEALASIGPEPSWIFARPAIGVLRELEGQRIAGGATGSGTLAFTQRLVAISGLDEDTTEVLPVGGDAAVMALQTGRVQAAVFVSNSVTQPIETLLRDESIVLLSTEQAIGLTRTNTWLTENTLLPGSVDYRDRLPEQQTQLLSTTALLAANVDLHPAFVDVLLTAATAVHGSADLFADQDEYPHKPKSDLATNADAIRYFEDGPTFFRRYLPFWVASFIERAWVLALPLLTVMFPLFRIAPPTYRWRIKRRIDMFYLKLQTIEMELGEEPNERDAAELKRRTQALDAAAARTSVPISYMSDLYQLRRHIAIVQARIEQLETVPG